MSDAEFDRHMAGVVKRRRLPSNPYAPMPTEASAPSSTMLRTISRAALPFGQRIRNLRCALGWTQFDLPLKQ
jgi:hypothetical protein